MSMTPEEATQIKIDIAVVKDVMSSVVEALKESSIAQRDTSKQIGELVTELKLQEQRDHQKDKDIMAMSDRIAVLDLRVCNYIEGNKGILEWLGRRKYFYDSLTASITSVWGKVIGAAIIVMVASYLGFDATKIIGK